MGKSMRHSPQREPRRARLAQGAGERFGCRTRRQHIIDHQDMELRPQGAGNKGRMQIHAAFGGAEARLGRRRAPTLAHTRGETPVELPAQAAGDLFGLVEAALCLTSPVQQHGYHQVRALDA